MLPSARLTCLLPMRPPPTSTLFPYTTLFRSVGPGPRSACHRTLPHPGAARFRIDHLAGLRAAAHRRSEEHTSELQSLRHLVCRLLLKKKTPRTNYTIYLRFTATMRPTPNGTP